MAQEFDFDIGNVVGPPGSTGNGIKSIQLLSTSGLVKTYRITFTDDTHFDFSVSDGEDGNGISGASFDADTNELTITFDDGTSFTTPSLKGSPGTPGDDGYSPAVTIATITGGHRITITDEAHPTGQSFDVMDGSNDAGSVTYDETATYQSGTVGYEVSELSRHLNDLDGDVTTLETTVTGKADKTTYQNVSGTTLTLNPAVDNTMYLCGELTELTVTPPTSGIFAVRFTSGTTPTVVTLNNITMPDDWPTTLDASTTYEINVLNGLGVWQSWI